MTGDEGRQVFEAMLPQAEIDRLCEECGVIERHRKLNLGMLVRAMVISAGPPGGAYQADVLRAYLECEVPHVARSAFYRWFDEPLERCLGALAAHVLAYARAPQVDRAGPLCGVTDWYMVDATTVTVRDALLEAFPGTGGYAAIKGHQVLAVGCGAPVHDHFRPAREPDRRHLTIDASWRGSGLLADLADASLDRRRACDTHSVRCVIRRQEHWTPKVDYMARRQVPQEFLPGSDVDALLEPESRLLDGRVIDADGPVGRGRHALPRRLVGVQPPKGYGVFLTNLPPRIGPRQGADLYRGRWEIALSIRLDQSVHRLDAIDAEQPCTLQTLVQASLMASTSAALLAHPHHVQTRPPQAGAPRTQAPLHPRRLAWPLAVSCQSIAQAFERQGAEATQRWQKIAPLRTHSGKDPNWRRRPSVFDQLRGWKPQPIARKKTNGGDASHGNLKAVA